MATKRILTGLKPTSNQLHLGNYFGAIKPMIELSKEKVDSEIFLFLANLHSFTYVHDGDKLRQNTINVMKLYLACGINSEQFMIFNQASVPWHVQLWRVLTCLTHMWHMERMHAYKDAVQKGTANETSVGTFCYPILMAADILLYDIDFVPVGKDQKQHVEYTRDIAQKFNNQFGETFVLPEAYIQKNVATIPGIDGRKMSKSYDNYIWLLDDEKTLSKKIKQISTNTLAIEEPKNPDECNVYNIMKLFMTESEDKDMRAKYETWGLSYKYAKDTLFEKVTAFLIPIQEKYNNISDDEINKILDLNAEKANVIAEKKIQDVYKKVGFFL